VNFRFVHFILGAATLLTGEAIAERGVDTSVVTNQPVPITQTYASPTPVAPSVTVVQPTPVLIPSIKDVPPMPPPSRPPPPPFLNAPSSESLARQALRTQPPVLKQPETAAAQLPVTTTIKSTVQLFVVDPSGSDANNGSGQAPWRTLQHAADKVRPGDTVVVRPGIYEAFHTVRGGEKLKPITFRAEGKVVVIPAAGEVSTNTTLAMDGRDNILVKESDYVVIEGFTVRYAARAGIAVLDSRGVVVKNNTSGPNGVWGIFTGFAPEVQIIGNKTFSSKEQHGIYVSNSRDPADNPEIRGNECWDNGASGIQLNGDCTCGGDGMIDGPVIEGNIIHDNDFKGFSLISIRGGRIQNNLIYNNGRKAGAGGIHLTDELGCGKASVTNVVANNTIVEPRIAGIRITDDAKHNILFNNIVISAQPIVDEVGDNQIDSSSNVTGDSGLGIFTNPTDGNYRLLPTSRATGKGRGEFAGHFAPAFNLEGKRRQATLGFDAGAY
jgi:parallel beta-helix repeat protein